MSCETLMIPNRNLPCGMILTHLFKYLKVDLSWDSVVPHAVCIDRSLLKRMHAASCVRPTSHVLPPPQGNIGSSSSSDPYSSLLNQMHTLSLRHASAISPLERVLSNQDEIRATQVEIRGSQNEFQNTLAYTCNAQCYLQDCNDNVHSHNWWPLSMLSTYSYRLPLTSFPVNLWIAPTAPSGTY